MKPNYNFIIRKAVEIYEMLNRYKKNKPYIYKRTIERDLCLMPGPALFAVKTMLDLFYKYF